MAAATRTKVMKPKVKKGDTVEVIAGKSKGVTGTVLRVYPVQQKVLVEGANRVDQAHQGRPDAARCEDRRHRPPGSADPHQQRDARGSGVEEAHPRRVPLRRRRRARSALLSEATRTFHDHDNRGADPASAQAALPRRDRGSAARGVRLPQRDAGASADQDRGQHGRRRRSQGQQADRRCRPRLDRDHRAEADGDQGAQVDRAVQAARGHADRRARHAARRPDVGVSRPHAVDRAAANP